MAAAKKKLENPPVGFDAANPKLPGPKVQAVPKPTVKATVTRHHFDGNVIKVIGEKAPVREGSRRDAAIHCGPPSFFYGRSG